LISQSFEDVKFSQAQALRRSGSDSRNHGVTDFLFRKSCYWHVGTFYVFLCSLREQLESA
jgi:hypothetical protein